MLGDGRPSIKVCCGPRCGVEPAHRAVYDTVVRSAPPDVPVVPTLCRGRCGGGVTLVRESGEAVKARDIEEARRLLLSGTAPRESFARCEPEFRARLDGFELTTAPKAQK